MQLKDTRVQLLLWSSVGSAGLPLVRQEYGYSVQITNTNWCCSLHVTLNLPAFVSDMQACLGLGGRGSAQGQRLVLDLNNDGGHRETDTA